MVLNISCGEDKKKDDNKDEKGFISAREELEANGWSYMGDVRFVSTFSEVEDVLVDSTQYMRRMGTIFVLKGTF